MHGFARFLLAVILIEASPHHLVFAEVGKAIFNPLR